MKSKVIIAISILLFVLTAIGLIQLFQRLSVVAFNETSTYIFISVLIVCSLVGVWGIVRKNKDLNAKRVSSLLTPLYSVYLPLLSFVLFICSLLSIFQNLNDGKLSDRMIVVSMFLVWSLIGLKYAKLKLLYIDQNRLYYTSFFSIKNCNLSDIKEVKRYMRYLYKIRVQSIDKECDIVFMPRVKESLVPFTTPAFVLFLQKMIDNK